MSGASYPFSIPRVKGVTCWFGRTVLSLATLTRAEATEVWSYSCALAERPTLPSVIFQAVGA